jgi:dTDP-4-dehydrorhamnose reductase
MMRVLVTGALGQLGSELVRTAPAELEVVALDLPDFDLTRFDDARRTVAELAPRAIVNAAAYTAVDKAEDEPGLARAVNADGAAALAEAATRAGARLIHVSTDYVFDGALGRPYQPDDPVGPTGVYGETKAAGERAVLEATRGAAVVVRTAWLYSAVGQNFVKTMLRLLATREQVSVVADQVGSPTWARGLAEALWRLLEAPDVRGIQHWTDAGVASWYDFAVAIAEEGELLGLLTRPAEVRPITTAEYPTRARRPNYSVLRRSPTWAALGLPAVHWRAQLRRMLRELANG